MAQSNNNESLAEAKIEISLSRLGQLFNSLDPSPFHERDLDQDAEEYIIGSAEEIARQRPPCLVIDLPADQLPQQAASISAKRFTTILLIAKRRTTSAAPAVPRRPDVLIIGLPFLFFCVLLQELALSLGDSAVSDTIGENMLIIGWVAMWRPLEGFFSHRTRFAGAATSWRSFRQCRRWRSPNDPMAFLPIRRA